MKNITNHIPQSYIISESFPNEEGIRTLFAQSQPSFYTSLEEKNAKDKISSLEKSVEANGNSLGTHLSTSTKNNKDYLLQLRKIQQSVFNHSVSTVLFTNVSNNFANIVQSYECHQSINRYEFPDELRFWLTPEYSRTKELSLFFLEIYNKFISLHESIKTKLGITNPNEIKRLMPNSYGINLLYTTGMINWQNLIEKGTAFSEDSEVRFVLINLMKAFKYKHSNLFSHVSIENKNGQKFGIDTLKSSENAWIDYKIIFN